MSAENKEDMDSVIDDCAKATNYNIKQAKTCIRAAIRKANLGKCNFCRKEVIEELDLALKHLDRGDKGA
jgi:hypothetical protein